MRTLAGLLLLACAAGAEDIDRDTRLPAGTRGLDQPLRVVADGVTLDLGDAVLTGANAAGDPDGYTGIGLVVEGRKKVTIRGGRLRGFRCAILVKDCEEVVLENVDVSGNFRQRLRSTPEKEDGRDWLWPHNNDKQEWRKNYGAGICLENCKKCIVRNCKGRKQQNGLLLDRCTGCEVYDNDFSFNSGWGIALWRSSKNMISRNSCDWCVRGYSHGVYDRGQDSAGILVFEQCMENVFALNSATHSGDGFFLFAGNETLKETGKGGCNKNQVIRNDFSHAVANAIEATFSTYNVFLENRCDDSNYGIWAGYSSGSKFTKNLCRDNSVAGIAIEHGRSNSILDNTFARNPRGIWLWWDDDKDLLASAFGRARPCTSHRYWIQGNRFVGDKIAVFLRDTTGYEIRENVYEAVGSELHTEGKCEATPGVTNCGNPLPRREPLGKRDAMLPEDHPRGRKYIMVDEWGPLDPKEVAVFPRRVVAWEECAFHVLGAKEYTVEGLPAGLTAEKGPRTFRVRSGSDGIHEFSCTVKVGDRSFDVEGVLLKATWRVRHWRWEKDPREHDDWRKKEPLSDRKLGRLDFAWQGGAPADGVPADRFATIAETKMRLPGGRYEIRTVSDDGVRVLIDGKKVQEDWTWHAPRENKTVVELSPGDHEIVVEHFEIDGHAALSFDLRSVEDENEPLVRYEGKYKNDPRLAGLMGNLLGARRGWGYSLRKIKRFPPPAVRLEDAGRDPSGAWAVVRTSNGKSEVVLKTEYLVLRAYRLGPTLAHEFFHCIHRDSLGPAVYAQVPEWVREGAALYAARQWRERARVLAAFVGRDPLIDDPLGHLVDGLGGEHGLLDYYEDVAAFDAVAKRHGRDRARELIRALLKEPDIARAVRDVLDEDMEFFERAARDHARKVLKPLIEEGRASILAARRHLDAKEPQKALAVLESKGVYAATAAYYRALALEQLGRSKEALRHLRRHVLAPHRRATTLLDQAIRLELRLLKATGSDEYEAAAAQAALDLTPFTEPRDGR